jgi:hypothetical protein
VHTCVAEFELVFVFAALPWMLVVNPLKKKAVQRLRLLILVCCYSWLAVCVSVDVGAEVGEWNKR